MAITTARIQVRRGLYAEFEPTKLMPGEWAVSIDTETSRQVVWMCFSPGVTKRMGTLEDFEEQIREATSDIRKEYENALNAIKNSTIDETTQIKNDAITQMTQIKTETLDQSEQIRQQAIEDLNTIIGQYNTVLNVLQQEIIQAKESVDSSCVYIGSFETELKEILIPKIEGYLSQSEENARIAKRWAVGQKDYPESTEDNSKYYSEQSRKEYERAKNEADRASQYSGVVVPSFHIDFTTMELIQENTGKGIEFTLENGELKFEFID